MLRVEVSSEEAEDLARRGVEVSVGRWRRVGGYLGSHAGLWIGILVAALIAPAIAKQWSDRNSELSLKNDLVASLSSSVALSVSTADEIARRGGTKLDRQNALDDWIGHQSALNGSVIVYFPGTGVVQRLWSNTVKKPNSANYLGFRDLVYDYVELSCCAGSAKYRVNDVNDIALVLSQFGQTITPEDRKTLTVPHSEGFVTAYHRLGLRIFSARNKLLRQLAQAHAEGFSRGWGDFFHNVTHPVG